MRYREVCYDILTTLRKTTDDTSIELYHILYWVAVTANKLNRYNFDGLTTISGNERVKVTNDTGLYLTVFPSVSVSKDAALHNRKYIELPSQIFDLPNERAVRYITYNKDLDNVSQGANFGSVTFQPTTPSRSHILYKSEFTKPSSSEPYFYRVGSKLYFLGIEDIQVSDVEVGLFTSIDPTNIDSLDDELPLPDELVSDLIKEVLNLGRFLTMTPEDLNNDGLDSSNQAPLVRNVSNEDE